ncbi:foldase protein PrsA [Alkalibacterium putridalgicola]|uniref:Foldase protein PrsA n=1 Tax=Alkalibacterium putridalgicola TaxID=426703 RepID=A0A1H7SZF3_9LACT|nr:peptidylprolyl isomerase [Alkalibacterium putridalgicola]GEK89252.1 foldase protein PrsA [Alkalibacterium putridalgicola]SEL77695.1 foldase protein PrsA [Alkalibacterium putridalgicola]
MKKWLVGAMACSGLLLASCANSEGEEVASTEAGRVRESELYERMKSEPTQGGMTYGEQMLQQILLEDILENEFKEDVTDEEVDAAFEEEAEQYGGVEAFEEMLTQQGMSADDVKENIRTSLYVEEAIMQHTEMTEEDVQAAYDEYVVNSTVAHILVEEEELAKDIIDQLNEGADFGELVAEYSTDTGTVEAGGELPLEPGRFVPEFEEAALKLEEGEITQEPVKSQFGYHIIKMVEEGEKGTLEEERENIETMIIEGYMQDQEMVQQAISQVVQDANVQIADDELSGAMQQFMQMPEVEEPAEESPDAAIEEDEEPAEDTETSEEDTETSEEDTEDAE